MKKSSEGGETDIDRPKLYWENWIETTMHASVSWMPKTEGIVIPLPLASLLSNAQQRDAALMQQFLASHGVSYLQDNEVIIHGRQAEIKRVSLLGGFHAQSLPAMITFKKTHKVIWIMFSIASLHYAKKMIKPEARLDCGYEGITRKRCQRIGCCFDPTSSGAPVCFHPTTNNVSRQCVMDRSAREDCGYPGITAEECQAKGCCFNSYVVSTRWCFHPLSDPGHAKMCGMTPKKRTPCGYPGISSDDCLGRGCCYEHYQYANSVPLCFEPAAQKGNFSL
ncbi:hypothetical protein JRQ81_020110 [Phrynocephalus forsythii]|uniref:P-type domain-containing protein n=1 Tax=Phrynocephalus forsythii TaxID=171643 RepID=A0A9Q0XRK3_9SAUR|nr:hypothetical protein JRQ81_020110 [Phrynocephalus forsythii]